MAVEQRQYLTAEQLAQLHEVSTLRSLGSLLWTWAVIVGCFALYIAHPSLWTFLIGWIVMSGRHLALAILMHEGAHRQLVRNKLWNDRIGQWLTAYPAMADMLVYRRVHLLHHRHTWTEQDPDLQLAVALPVSPSSFRRKMLRDLTGQTAYARHRRMLRYAAGLDPHGRGFGDKRIWHALLSLLRVQRGFLITNGILLAALSALGHPEAFVLLWWLPSWTGYSVVLRIRAIAEHACIDDPADPLRNTRTTLAPGWLRLLLAPHHVNYHLEHHLFMAVPHYNLPAAHRMLRDVGVLDRAEIAPSYLQVLRKATSAPA